MSQRVIQSQLILLLLCLLTGGGCSRPADPPTPPVVPGPNASSQLEEIKAETRRDYPDVSHVTTQQVEDWLADTKGQTLLFDVREPGEFAISHLSGAINLSPSASAAESESTELKGVPKDRRIVLYCSVGVRSSKMARLLNEAGYTNVHNMAGSIFQWANDGRALKNANGPATTVHPYDQRWGQLLKPQYRAKPEG